MSALTFELQVGKTSVLELKLGQYMVGATGPTGQDGPVGPEGSLTPDDTAALNQAVSDAQAAASSATDSAASASTSETSSANSASAAASSATTAATSATNASNSAGAASSSATAAGNSASAASTSQTAANTSATNAGNSATAAGNSQTAAATSETNAAASAQAAAMSVAGLSNRNYIIDGNFENWINTSVTTSAAVNNAATMYYINAAAGGTATISQVLFTVGNAPGGMTTPARYMLRWVQSVAATANPVLSQRLESALTLEGKSATFSCWLRSNSGNVTIPSIGFVQKPGTGGSPAGGATVSVPVNWVVTGVWQRFSVRLDIPSASGMVLGTNKDDSLWVQLQYPANATFNIDTDQWQLEQSSPQAPAAGSPTPFEYRGQQAELARVQRYYQGQTILRLWGYANAGQAVGATTTFATRMRVPPGFTYSSVNFGNASGVNVQDIYPDLMTYYTSATVLGSVALAISNAVFDARL